MALQRNDQELHTVDSVSILREPVNPSDKNPPSSASNKRDWWIWEIFGVVGSGCAIGGMGVLLYYFSGTPVPRWPISAGAKNDSDAERLTHISFNSILSMLSTFARICLLIPISRGLAQLKWVWLAEEKRKLTDLVDFEAASRQSLIGAISLVWTLKGRHFAVIGAAALLAMLGFDFFVQSLVTYPSVLMPMSTTKEPPLAQIAQATNYSVTVDNDDSGYLIDSFMKAGIWDSLFATDPNSDWAVPKYFCATGSCTWGDFSSLGVCSRCADITPQLRSNCTHKPGIDPKNVTGCDYHLSSGLSLGGSGIPRNTVMAVSANSSPLVFDNYTSTIAIIQSIIAYDTNYINTSTLVKASECALVPCVIEYESTELDLISGMTDGSNGRQYYEYAQQIWDNFIIDSQTNATVITLFTSSDGLSDSDEYDTDSDEYDTGPNQYEPIHYFIASNTYEALKRYIRALLNGYVMSSNSSLSYMSANPSSNITIDSISAMQAIYQDVSGCRDIFGNNITDWNICAMNWLSVGMTRVMRDASFDNSSSTKADTWQTVPIINVVWFWIIPIGICWILSLVILIGTAYRTRRSKVMKWGGDPLALLFIDVDDEAAGTAQDYGLSNEGLEKRARNCHVQLRIKDNQAHLVGKDV